MRVWRNGIPSLSSILIRKCCRAENFRVETLRQVQIYRLSQRACSIDSVSSPRPGGGVAVVCIKRAERYFIIHSNALSDLTR